VGRSPQLAPGAEPGAEPLMGRQENPLKLKTFELVDTKRKGKSAKFWIFWTRSSAHVEVDSTVFTIFYKIL